MPQCSKTTQLDEGVDAGCPGQPNLQTRTPLKTSGIWNGWPQAIKQR